jgi:hypothetical protein
LEDFKKYCKNDVRMTALVLLYLLHYKKLFLEGEEIAFSIEDLVNESNSLVPEAAEVVNQEQRNASLFA